MVTATPLILVVDLKISDQNSWGQNLSKKLNFIGGGAGYEPQQCHGCCVKIYSLMFVRLEVHMHSLY